MGGDKWIERSDDVAEVAENQSAGEGSEWIERWDDFAQVPFMHKGDNWVSYENEKSIAIKVRHEYL